MEVKIEQMTASGILGLLRQHPDITVAGSVTILTEGSLWMQLDREQARLALRELPGSELIYATVQEDPWCLLLGVQMEPIHTYEMDAEEKSSEGLTTEPQPT